MLFVQWPLCAISVTMLISHEMISLFNQQFFSLFFTFLCTLTDTANRGLKKFGDKCEKTEECGFPGSICDSKKRSCQCIEELPVTNHIDKCGKGNVLIAF